MKFAPPKREDYPKPKTGGGWHRSASRQVYVHTPYKTEKSLYRLDLFQLLLTKKIELKNHIYTKGKNKTMKK